MNSGFDIVVAYENVILEDSQHIKNEGTNWTFAK